MSYNIDSVKVLSGTLRIKGSALAEIYKLLESPDAECESYGLPEHSFLVDLPVPVFDASGTPLSGVPHPEYGANTAWASETEYPIRSPQWCFSGSGSYYKFFRTEILTRTLGSADLVYSWERGDSLTGLRVEDGKVTQHKVKMTLVLE